MNMPIDALDEIVSKLKNIQIDWRHINSKDFVQKTHRIQTMVMELNTEIDEYLIHLYDFENSDNFLGMPAVNHELINSIRTQKKLDNALYQTLLPYYIMFIVNNTDLIDDASIETTNECSN